MWTIDCDSVALTGLWVAGHENIVWSEDKVIDDLIHHILRHTGHSEHISPDIHALNLSVQRVPVSSRITHIYNTIQVLQSQSAAVSPISTIQHTCPQPVRTEGPSQQPYHPYLQNNTSVTIPVSSRLTHIYNTTYMPSTCPYRGSQSAAVSPIYTIQYKCYNPSQQPSHPYLILSYLNTLKFRRAFIHPTIQHHRLYCGLIILS